MEKFFLYLPAAGRILLSQIFIIAGLSKIGDWGGTSAYMASKGMPMVPLLLPAAIAVELLGGLSLLLGFFSRYGALLLILFLLPATFIFHDFWNIPESEAMALRMQMIMFMKNMAIMGGLSYIVSFGSGALSIDAMKERG